MASPAKRIKRRVTILSTSATLPEEAQRRLKESVDRIDGSRDLQGRRQDDVQDGDGKQEFPAEVHQLIETKTRQPPAQPEEQEEDDLAEKIDWPKPGQLLDKGAVPAAHEKRRRQHRDREHVDVLGHEEERELHRAVFRVKARDQLRLRPGQIERNTIRLRNRRDKVDDEAKRLNPEDVPAHPLNAVLLLDDAVEIERARLQHYSDQRQPQRQLVRDELRRRTQAAHQAVLVI